MLETRSVSRRYGELKAVDDFSFSVARGEIVGLLGHNGAGKTTIMKMLSGALEPDSGSILLDGEPILADPARLQRTLGYLPENLPLYPELTLAAYLDYAADLKGLRGDAKRTAIRRAIDATELGERLLSPIGTLSRGLKQRAGVAQALLGDPSLLILDEPTNGLDPRQTEQMRALIRGLAETATVILSTHVMQEVEAVCERALIVRRGRLAVDVRLAELVDTRVRLSTPSPEALVRRALAPLPGIADAWIEGATPSAATGGTAAPHASLTHWTLEPDAASREHGADAFIARLVPPLVEAGVAIAAIRPAGRDLQSLFLEVGERADDDIDEPGAGAGIGEARHVA